MLRRRPFIRRRLFRQGSAIGTGPRQMLIRANQFKDSGNYLNAADIYERLGKGAQDRGMLNQAPHLYLEAAHCRLLAKQIKPGIDLMWQGFHLLEKASRWQVINQHGNSWVEELERLRLLEASNKLQIWLEQVLKDHIEAIHTHSDLSIIKTSSRVPEKCPFCGASIQSNFFGMD